MNCFDTDKKIEENQKQLAFYYDMSSKLQNKISILVVFYSFIFFYLIELVKYLFQINFSVQGIIYLAAFCTFLVLFIQSILKAYNFFKPEDVAYLHSPNYFYIQLLDEYKNVHGITDEELLDVYVKESYLKETEVALEENTAHYRKKSDLFYHAFIKTLQTLLVYILLSSFVLYENRDNRNKIEIENYKEILNHINATKMSEKPKIDPKLIITTQPIRVKQGAETRERSVPQININKKDYNPSKKK